MSRRRLVGAALALAAATASAGCGARREPPNVVLVSVDTLRADHLGCYGYARATSPTLDALAAEGTRFASVTAAAPWTLPSHATLLTGLYPHDHGVKNYGTRLADGTPTIATILGGRGYQTMAIVNHHFLGPDFGLTRDFARVDYVSEWSDEPPESRRLIDRGEEITTKAIEWLGHRDGRPFLLFLHYFDLHSDYAARPEYRAMFAAPDYAGPIDGTTQQLLEMRANGVQLDAADRAQLTALYDAEYRQLDDQLARLLRALDQGGLAARTLVVITSDHGEELMDHGSVLHGRTMYQEVIGVPLILRGPGIPRGARVAQDVSLADVAPTLLAAVGASFPAGVDGRSVVGYWADPDRLRPEHATFAEADWMNARPDSRRMVRRGGLKLHLDLTTDGVELYDVIHDPHERHDLAAQEPARVRELRAELAAFSRSERTPATAVPPSSDVLDRLRALGYAK